MPRRNLVRHFDLSVAVQNCAELPDLVWIIMEKAIFRGIGEIFQFLSAEFPFSEHRILGGLFEHHLSVKSGQSI